MKTRILATIFAVATVLSGCSKSDTLDTTMPYLPSDDAISFSDNADNWSDTRGEAFDDSNLDEMEVYAYYTAQDSYADDSNVTKFMHSQLVTKDATWSYSPIKYWSNNDGDKFSFYAFTPHSAVTCSHDETTGKPSFSYTMSQNASENDDFSAAAPKFDCTKKQNGSEGVKFDFKHKLTRITLMAAIKNATPTVQNETNIRYVINGFTLYNVNSSAELNYDNDTWSWSTPTTPINYTAANGLTLFAYDDPAACLNKDPKSVMIDENAAIFVLPQDVTNATLQVRVRKIYDSTDDDGNIIKKDCEIIYATSNKVKIPVSEFKEAEWINMTFTFDAGNLQAYDTPMTISSQVYDWTDASVSASMHRNLYIYSSKSDIVAETDPKTKLQYGDFEICTNYDYNLCVPHHRLELDGAVTSSHGFLFCTDDFNHYNQTNEIEKIDIVKSVETGEMNVSYKVFQPTLLTKGGKELVYVTKDNLDDYHYTYTTNSDGSYTLSNNDIVYFDNNDFVYEFEQSDGRYRLLYYDPDNNTITKFKYENDPATEYYQIDLSDYEDANGRVYFKIIIGDLGDGKDYSFDFSIERSTRDKENLYVSGAIDPDGKDNSYGVNKEGDDAVYLLRMSVNAEHLKNQGVFDDIIGVEMVSNGGGMIEHMFPVTLKSGK